MKVINQFKKIKIKFWLTGNKIKIKYDLIASNKKIKINFSFKLTEVFRFFFQNNTKDTNKSLILF